MQMEITGESRRAVQEPPRSILRLLNLLELLASFRHGASLTELAEALNMPKSSLLLLIKALVTSGHVTLSDKRYRLGTASFALGHHLLAARPNSAVLKEVLLSLWERVQETVVMTTLDRDRDLVTYADAIESPLTIRYAVKLGQNRPLYCTAAGKAALAFQDPEWIEAYLARTELAALTPQTITDPARLRLNLREIRAQGVAVSISEAVPNSIGIAAPIHDADARVERTILIAGPADRMAGRIEEMVPVVRECAMHATKLLRYAV